MSHPDYAPIPMTCRSCKKATEWNRIGCCIDCIASDAMRVIHSSARKDDDEAAMLIMRAVAR